jgi:hypothetical protein
MRVAPPTKSGVVEGSKGLVSYEGEGTIAFFVDCARK